MKPIFRFVALAIGLTVSALILAFILLVAWPAARRFYEWPAVTQEMVDGADLFPIESPLAAASFASRKFVQELQKLDRANSSMNFDFRAWGWQADRFKDSWYVRFKEREFQLSPVDLRIVCSLRFDASGSWLGDPAVVCLHNK